jgi:hypothetical protein
MFILAVLRGYFLALRVTELMVNNHYNCNQHNNIYIYVV